MQQEIKRLFVETSWRYCPTADNPADLLTRSITATQLHSSVTWLHGPLWLTADRDWPMWESATTLMIEVPEQGSPDVSSLDQPETVPVKAAQSSNDCPKISNILDFTKHSTLGKLLRVTAYVFRFVYNTIYPLEQRTGPLTVTELALAENKWIHDRQLSNYSNEFANISSQAVTKPRTPLVRQLRLFVDEQGLLRWGGRIHNAPVSNVVKFPLLLPKKDHLTNLIIRETHARQLHSGINSTLTALRQKFWVPAGR